MNDFAIVIPVYKHGEALQGVIQGVLEHIEADSILIVDDGSPEAIKSIAKNLGTRIIRHENNQGKGQSLNDGLNYWYKAGKKYAICLDGDGQHSPEDLDQFIDHPDCDLLIGSRMQNLEGMPKDRQFSNKTTSKILSRLLRRKIEDSQCGYRRVKLESFKKFNYRERGFAFESEMIVWMAKANLDIEFTPIKTLYFENGPSSMNRFTDTLRFLRAVFKTLVSKC